MIAPHPPHPSSSQPIVHLVAPPSSRTSTHKHLGRTIPCLLLASAINPPKHSPTPPSPQNRLITIGDSSCQTTAKALGLNPTDHFTPLLSKPSSVKSKILHRLQQTNTKPTRIICWSDELISLASSIASNLDIPTELISTKPALITKPPHNIDTIRIFDPQDHDRWQELRHTCQTDQTLAANIHQNKPTHQSRAAARSSLSINDQTIVIAAIADAPDQVDAREFAFLLGLLSVSGYTVLGIIPKTAKNLTQALRHHRGLQKPFRILTTTDPLPNLLPLLDTYIHPNDHTSGSTLLIDRLLQNAGIPILNLRHSGKAGFSRAQGTAGQLLNEMDQIVHHMQSNNPISHL